MTSPVLLAYLPGRMRTKAAGKQNEQHGCYAERDEDSSQCHSQYARSEHERTEDNADAGPHAVVLSRSRALSTFRARRRIRPYPPHTHHLASSRNFPQSPTRSLGGASGKATPAFFVRSPQRTRDAAPSPTSTSTGRPDREARSQPNIPADLACTNERKPHSLS